MPDTPKWYIITGGPSTGKSTLLAELSKLGHTVVPEAARLWIDENLAKGISVAQMRSDEKRFQENIVRLKQKIEAGHQTDVMTFFDRGIHDTLAYMQYYNFEVASWMMKAMRAVRYNKVFVLEPLGLFERDYARTEDARFTEKMTGMLENIYKDYGMVTIKVPPISVKERAQFVLEHLDQA